MGGSKVIQVANIQVGERRDEVICVILCIEYALEGRDINTTNNMLYLLRYLHIRFHEHSCNVHNPNNISIILGANEG